MKREAKFIFRKRCFNGIWYPTVGEFNKAVRIETIRLLGGKCVRCGFEDWRALQADHVNGRGEECKKAQISLYYDIKLCLRREIKKYQCLCANCNWIKRYENDEHNDHRSSVDYSSGGSVCITNANVN